MLNSQTKPLDLSNWYNAPLSNSYHTPNKSTFQPLPISSAMSKSNRSNRKPIFEQQASYISKDNWSGYKPVRHHPDVRVSQQQYCGCEHNLQPCGYIMPFMSLSSIQDMRNQYQRCQALAKSTPKQDIRNKYFHLLPPNYPELYHTHLYNAVGVVQWDLSPHEFMTIAWIHYHAKLQHLTFFLFCDLARYQPTRNQFIQKFQLSLIQHQITYTYLLQQAKSKGANLALFIQQFYQSKAANVVPLVYYSRFLKQALMIGIRVMDNLLVLLVTKYRSVFFQKLGCYHAKLSFREEMKQMDWEDILQQAGKQVKPSGFCC